METNIGLVSPLFAKGVHDRWSLRSNSPAMKSFPPSPYLFSYRPVFVLCLWSKLSTTEQLSILDLLKWGDHLPSRSALSLPSLAMSSSFSKNPLGWDTILEVRDNNCSPSSKSCACVLPDSRWVGRSFVSHPPPQQPFKLLWNSS